jgi:hypothetical protein
MRPLQLLFAAGCLAVWPLAAPAQTPDPPALPTPAVVGEAPPDAANGGTFTFTPEYVLWWLREGRVPALLTTSSQASQGKLGESDTRVLYGDERLPTRHDDRFNGLRLALEWTAPGGWGVEARGFVLERDSTYFKATSDGSVLLAEPYTNPLTGQQESRLVAGDDPRRGLLSGGYVGYSRIEWFGEEVNGVVPLAEGPVWRADLLAGVRFLQMRDRFNDTNTSTSQPGLAPQWGEDDNIRTGNAFYGAQLGVRGEADWGRAFVQVRVEGALGADVERVRLAGGTLYQTAQVRTVTPTGLYVQGSNTGEFRHASFDAAGEVDLNVGYRLTRRVRVFAGYTFLGWANPLRAGDQIDTVVNRLQPNPPTPALPTVPFRGDALWAQGLNLGAEVRW